MNSIDNEEWVAAMQEELISIKSNDTWELMDLPADKRAIGSKWVFKVKENEFGLPVKCMARLVAQAFTQKYGLDYDEIFALVVRSTKYSNHQVSRMVKDCIE